MNSTPTPDRARPAADPLDLCSDPLDLRIVLLTIAVFLTPTLGALIACIGWHYGWWP
jgi:hypothetical protein